MHVFSLIFIPSFPFLYHFDTVLGAFFGLGGGGGGLVMTPLIPMEHWREFFFVWPGGIWTHYQLMGVFMEVSNPGLEGFDTVLGGLFGLGGGGVTPHVPMELCGGKKYCWTRQESNPG